MKYITDKSKIKNGMFVATQDDVVFVRIGGRLSKIDLNYFYSFDGLKQEEIKTIFKSNGKALLEKETETHAGDAIKMTKVELINKIIELDSRWKDSQGKLFSQSKKELEKLLRRKNNMTKEEFDKWMEDLEKYNQLKGEKQW